MDYSDIPIKDFVDIALTDGQHCDEAMYYLLHERLGRQLEQRFEPYRYRVWDDFDDVVEDFFLYLREGKDGESRYPFQGLKRIRNKEAFEMWVLNTFRNYVNNRASETEHVYVDSIPDNLSCVESTSPLTDERMLAIMSELIAYCLQVFYPRGRFIFLRLLLTILNKQNAISTSEMAEALGMSYTAYRVMSYRMKANLRRFRYILLQGGHLRLKPEYEQIAIQVNTDFAHLYPTLMTYYLATLEQLKTREAVRSLRQQYLDAMGHCVHEPEPKYELTVKGLWNRLNKALIA